MSRSKAIRYLIPGVFGEMEVRLVSRRTLCSRVKDRKKDEIYNGLYEDADHTIYIAKELHGSARISTLTHEIAHAVLAACSQLGEEEQCDLIGAFYQRLYADQAFLGCLDEIGRA
jgi:hypothetical protein